MNKNTNAASFGANGDEKYNYNDNTILAQNVSWSNKGFDSKNMPVILQKIDKEFMQRLFPDMRETCRLNILLAKTISMLSHKHIKFKEFENIKLVNHYAICFIFSGGGKDKPINDLNTHIFKQFGEYAKSKSDEYFNKKMKQIEQEIEKLADQQKMKTAEKNKNIYLKRSEVRKMVLEINIATPEGLTADATTIKDAGYGSLFVKISELGLFLNSKDKTFLAFLTCLFQGYDGIIESKSIKYGKREETIENIPLNTLLYSDPSLFQKSLKEFFDLLMQTGLARRAFLTFQPQAKKTIEKDPLKAYSIQQAAYASASIISNELFDVFNKIPHGATYEMTTNAYADIFHFYKIDLNEMYNNMDDKPLLQKELASRELKVLKLACAFACLNHPTVLEISENDFSQAINVVNYLGKDFALFLKNKPTCTEEYISLIEEMAETLGKKINKTNFVELACKHGFNRKDFRHDFEEEIATLKEIASDKGYELVMLDPKIYKNKNNAIYICLQEKRDLSLLEVSEI